MQRKKSKSRRLDSAQITQDASATSDVQFSTPVRRTEYYTALPSLSWQGVYYQVFHPDTFDLLGTLQSAWRTYSPGVRLATTWRTGPIRAITSTRPGTTSKS